MRGKQAERGVCLCVCVKEKVNCEYVLLFPVTNKSRGSWYTSCYAENLIMNDVNIIAFKCWFQFTNYIVI